MTKSTSSRSALAVVAMMAGSLLLLAGCPTAQTPEPQPAESPAAPASEAPRAAEAPAAPAPVVDVAPAVEVAAPAKPEPAVVMPAKPEPAVVMPAKPEAAPAAPEKPEPLKPSAAALPEAMAPVATVEKAPALVRSVPVFSPQPDVHTPPAQPVAQPVAPPYAKQNDMFPRPNPLRDGHAVEPLRAQAVAPASSPAPATEAMGPPVVEPTAPAVKENPAMAEVAATATPAHVAPQAGKPADDVSFGRGATITSDFDPIKENGTIFQGQPQDPGAWTKPRVALVITGHMEGYIEPCGCAGLDRMKGGIGRRHTFIDQLRTQGWPVVAIDLGGLSKGFGRQAELKFQTTVEAMKRMGYDAIGLGPSDLRLPGGELLSVTKGVGDQQSPFISANVGLFTLDPPMIDAYRVVEAGGMRVGITAVLGREFQKQVQNTDLIMADPEEKLAQIVPKLKKEADYLVLLAFATTQEAIDLGRRFREFNMVVTAGGGPEPPGMPERIDGQTLLIGVGEKGMNAIVVGLYEDAQRPWRYQRVPLDSRFRHSPEMRMLMESYQDQLKTLGFAGLGLRAVPYPQKRLMGTFVGSQKCQDCHEESYRVWKKSGHSHAFRTLTSLNPPRHFDPECISCHVIGWHPQEYFPYEGGYASLETTPNLIDVGCESCHGPGSAHAAAEQGTDEQVQLTLRKAMTVTKEESQRHLCSTCHDLDNSPAFKFDTYWPKVEHYEKE